MPVNLTLDDKLIELARRLGGHKTKQEAVTAALVEYIAKRKRLDIISLFGTIEMDPTYDYKTGRLRKR